MPNIILTKSEEDYIKAIFNLSEFGNKQVSTNSISKVLKIEPASVTDMIKKLSIKKLIYHQKYKGCKISKKGMKIALQIIRKHRLWEVFLSQTLNFSWDEVHEVAEELEHVRSEKLMSRLDKFLGFPKFDPHGDRIPSVDLVFSPAKGSALTDISSGQSCQFSAVRDDSSGFLRDLNKIGLKLGMELKILSKENNNINLKCSNSLKIEIPIALAKKVYVTII